MGADKNFLCIEPSEGVDPAALKDQLSDAEPFNRWSEYRDGTVIVVGYGQDHDPAVEALHSVADAVERAFLLHIYDTVMIGEGWVYEHDEDGLVERTSISGAETRYGIDVVDYIKREFDIDGPR